MGLSHVIQKHDRMVLAIVLFRSAVNPEVLCKHG